MIEIVIRNSLDKPIVVRTPGRLPEVHVGSNMSLNQIATELTGQISTAEFQKFKQLFTDDSYPRVFMNGEDYLKIMDKE